jgi:hypothetical protein
MDDLLHEIPTEWTQEVTFTGRVLQFGYKPIGTPMCCGFLAVSVAFPLLPYLYTYALFATAISALYFWKLRRQPCLCSPEQLRLTCSEFVDHFDTSIHLLRSNNNLPTTSRKHTEIFMTHGFGASALQFGVCMPQLAAALSGDVTAYDHLGVKFLFIGFTTAHFCCDRIWLNQTR